MQCIRSGNWKVFLRRNALDESTTDANGCHCGAVVPQEGGTQEESPQHNSVGTLLHRGATPISVSAVMQAVASWVPAFATRIRGGR